MKATFKKSGTKKSEAASQSFWSQLSQPQAQPQSLKAGGDRLFSFSFCLLLAALFLLSLAAQLAHHFLCDHASVMFAFDGKHYLATSQALTGALILLFKGNLPAFLATISGAAFCQNLVWDGPIIPGIPAVLFALAGRLPVESDWSYFAIFFSVLASYSAVLVAIGTRLLTGSNRLAVVAGVLFASYPTTLIATGVYRSEILAIALMLTLLMALYRAPRSASAAILAGIIGGVFAMVKPVMIPAIGLLCIFTGLHACQTEAATSRQSGLVLKAKLLALLALAGVLTIVPWSLYTALDCGKLSITAERGPSYNAGVGTDIAADGWCTMPETAHTAAAKLNKSPMAVFGAEWRAHPFELAKLTMRRVTRLWGNPWNDFREAVFGVPLQGQIIWHLILVTLGFMGLSLYIFFPPQKQLFASGGDVRLFGNLAAIALMSHLFFVMFQTMGRYAYTSMPLLALFGAYGLGVLHRRAVSRQARPRDAFIARAAAAAGIAFALVIFNCDGVTHVGESHETMHVLHPGAVACRSIDLSSQKLPADLKDISAILIMVDCGMKPEDQAGLALRLNGHLLPGPFLPLNCFNGKDYFLFDTMAEHAAFMRTSVQSFRQWRAVRVEPDANLLARDGLNEIEFVNGSKGDITIYGDSKLPSRKASAASSGAEAAADSVAEAETPVLLPSPDYFASDRMLISLTSTESRINTLCPASGLASRSFLKNTEKDTTYTRALSDSLRLQLAVALDPAGSSSQSQTESLHPAPELDVNIAPQQFHWFARTKEGFRVSKAVLKGVGPVSCETDLKSLSAGEPCTQIEVTVSGQACTNSGAGRLGVSAGLSNTQGLCQGLGQFGDYVLVPKSAAADKTWTTFRLSDVVPISKLGGLSKLDKLTLSFLPCPRLESCYGGGKQCSDIEVKDLHVSVRVLNLTDIATKTLTVY